MNSSICRRGKNNAERSHRCLCIPLADAVIESTQMLFVLLALSHHRNTEINFHVISTKVNDYRSGNMAFDADRRRDGDTEDLGGGINYSPAFRVI